MTIQVHRVQFFRLPMQTRFPFRYGIASMTKLPHLIVKAEVEVDGQRIPGFSSDGLPPKWFTKNPETTFENDDLPSMLQAIRHSADVAVQVGVCSSVFRWWKQVYDAQSVWAAVHHQPPLLAGFGVSLMERSVMDAFCRRHQITLHQALLSNRLQIDLATVRASLRSVQPRDIIPRSPRNSIAVRHTIGLSDPLSAADVHADDRPRDQLPLTLEENLQHYGLSHFKIKVSGDFQTDHDRLQRIADLLNRGCQTLPQVTLDGNENFDSMRTFREHWEQHGNSPLLQTLFRQSLLFVEQPVHRSHALANAIREELRQWPDAPPMIIDESDADFDCLPLALQLGYSGTSHKNCKGLIKGLANAATIAEQQRCGHNAVLSAEDLGNVGPFALTQDLAMAACLNVPHLERNGHHYFAGLSQFPRSEQSRAQILFSDLYAASADGYPTLQIQQGRLSLNAVNAYAFGAPSIPDDDAFESWQLVSEA